MFNAYSAMSQNFQMTINGTNFTYTASYTTSYVSSTTYKVVIASSAYATPFTMWLLKNGTIAGINYAGSNYTGAAASAYYQSSRLFTVWGSSVSFGQLLTTEYTGATSYFHSTGTSTETLGPSTFTVTGYAANSLPETIPSCGGVSDTLTTANLSVGSAKGSSYLFPTYVDVAGTGPTTSYSIVSQVTSVTVA